MLVPAGQAEVTELDKMGVGVQGEDKFKGAVEMSARRRCRVWRRRPHKTLANPLTRPTAASVIISETSTTATTLQLPLCHDLPTMHMKIIIISSVYRWYRRRMRGAGERGGNGSGGLAAGSYLAPLGC